MWHLPLFFLLPIAFAISGCVPDEPNPNPNPASPDFLTAQQYPTAAGPLAVRAADFNGDGKLDIATANRGSNTVSVLLTKVEEDDKAFQLHTDLPAGTEPVSLVVAQLIGASQLDILSVNTGSGSLSLFEGNADGSFNAAITLGLLATSAPLDAAAADFDGDGDNDIATADSATNTISILQNNGSGFQAVPVIVSVGNFPRAIVAVDLNKDNKPDLVTANRNSNTVSVLLNDGTGTFTNIVTVPTGEAPRQAEPLDANKDGNLDLVITCPTARQVNVLLGNGGGAFTPGDTVVLEALPSRCDSGDFNGDGNADLAAVMFSTAEGNPALGVADVLYGNGTGGFPTVRRYGLGGAAQDIVVADATGDGRPDLIAADAGGNAAVVIAGRTGGRFASDERIPTGDQPREVVSADLDNDNDLDLVVISQLDKSVTTYRNNGVGDFAEAGVVALAGTPRGLAVGTLNADAFIDVAVSQITGTDGVRLLFGAGNGTLTTTGTTLPLAGRDPRSVAIGDVNKDGKQDIVTGDSDQDEISVMLGDGAGAFAAAKQFAIGNFPLNLHLVDTNADNNLDVVFVSRNDPDSTTDQAQPRVVRVLGKGDGTFDTANILRVETGGDPRDMAMADISGDGLADFAVASAVGNAAYTHRLTGGGGVEVGVMRRAGQGPRSVVLPDIGGNNRRDIVTLNGDDTFSVITNFGSSAFTLSGTYFAGDNAIDGATGDYNKDGKPDLVILNQATNDMSVVFGV